MKVIADLQLHSKYSQAVSKFMDLSTIDAWSQKKGINLVATGDWTHPFWLKDLTEQLEETSSGIFQLKSKFKSKNSKIAGTKFLLSTEVSCVYYQDEKYHGVHILIFAPSLATVKKINSEFRKRGWEKNLLDDARPILPLSCRDLAALVLDIDPQCLIIPAHSWTPWFGYYGARGGFMSLDEGFKDYAKYIYAVETGLGSDPGMNWRIEELDNRNIVSFSDAHSAPKIGREATVFEVSGNEVTYESIREAITTLPSIQTTDYGLQPESTVVGRQSTVDYARIAYTIEFYRQEGKYHYTGHRKCNVSFGPENTPKDFKCPVCGKKLTVGAMQRTEDIAGRDEGIAYRIDEKSVRWVESKNTIRPPYVNLVPLQEIISEVVKVGVGSKKVQTEYERLVNEYAPEFEILLEKDLKEIKDIAGEKLAYAIEKVRRGDITVIPGYDGVFGKVEINLEDVKMSGSNQQELF